MGEYDLAAIDDRGRVYAVSLDDGEENAREFTAEILAQGGAVKRMPRLEAVERLQAYLNETWPAFAALSEPPHRMPGAERGEPRPPLPGELTWGPGESGTPRTSN